MDGNSIVILIKQHYPNVKLIYLFGSRASGQHNANSDWDIAVLNENKIPTMARWKLKELLANECHAEVDLIDLLDASTVLKMQVVENSQLLFDKSDYSVNFEMQVFSMYGRLQEGRKDIIDSFVVGAISKGAKHA